MTVATRPRLPRVSTMAERVRPHAPTLAVVGAVLLVLLSHGVNMLHYPYLEGDEGTYFGQGWSVFHAWRLAPYTYFYDHAPGGWIQIGIWQALTGFLHPAYGLASGRIFMLVVQVACALLIFRIARKASGQLWVALFAVAVFSLSSYGIYYHRRILLDNLATVWILAAVALLCGRVGLRHVWLSALALGIAVLSKEVAIAVIPACGILVARQVDRDRRILAVVGWLAVTAMTISIYPLMALLKSELFPAGSALGGSGRHVSLICSLMWQSSRAPDGGILDRSSAFWAQATSWAHAEPLLVIAGTGAALLAVVALRHRPVPSMIAWMAISLWLFLGRGGVVLSFYLVPLLPLLALSLALVVGAGVQDMRTRARPIRRIGAPAVAVAAVAGSLTLCAVAYERSDHQTWTGDPVAAQVDAVKWVEHHVPSNSRMVIDMSMWQDLRHPSGGAPSFSRAHYYWKVGQDPRIRRGVFQDSWHNVDYVIASPQLIEDTRNNGFAVVTGALAHSVSVRLFDTGGWPIDVRRVDPHATGLVSPRPPKVESAPSCMDA